MAYTKTDKLFNFIQRIFFKEIGDELRPGTLKFFTNFLYIIFEKMGNNFEIISKSYIKIYEEVVKQEIKLANISSDDRILIIGCGSIPSTSIILAEKTNAKIVSIDIDPQAVIKASRYVKTHNLQNNIEITIGDGALYPVKDFDVIFVLYGVGHHQQLLRHLAENISKKTRLVCRAPNNVASKKKKYISFLSNMFRFEKIVTTTSFGSMDSILLYKKT